MPAQLKPTAKPSATAPVPPPAADTKARLLDAARAEFADPGYGATNTNRIARRAGFAPQTFYRHFADKRAIFLDLHSQWVEEDYRSLGALRTAGDRAAALIAHHRADLRFRRSLATLGREDDQIAAARARSRHTQLQRLGEAIPAFAALPRAVQLARLLTIEHLADAIAEGEFAALNITEEDATAALGTLIDGLGRPAPAP